MSQTPTREEVIAVLWRAVRTVADNPEEDTVRKIWKGCEVLLQTMPEEDLSLKRRNPAAQADAALRAATR